MGFKKITGFTLNELILVVIILGILVAIAIPSYSKVIERVRAKEAKSALGLIRAGQKIYRSKNPNYLVSCNILDINSYLGLDLEGGYWNYCATEDSPAPNDIGTATHSTPNYGYKIDVAGNITCYTGSCPE